MTLSRGIPGSLPYDESPLASGGFANLSMPFRLLLPRSIYEEMIAQALAELPNECCGLLAGKMEDDAVARVLCRFPLVNKMARPTSYLSADRSLLNAHVDLRKNGLEFPAVHPSD